MKKYFYALSYILFLISCGDKKVILKNEIEIITTENSKSKITELTSILTCFDNSDTTIVFYPITYNRIDKENGQILFDFLSNKQVIYEKISPIKRDFKKFFDGLNDSILSSKGNIEYNIDNYISLPNSFVFSNEIVKEPSLKGKIIYNDITKLHNAISSYLTLNKGKIYIIYNPTLSSTQPIAEAPKPVIQESTNTNSNTVITNTKVVKTETTISKTASSSPCPNKISGSSLDDCFRKLADASIPRECKNNLKNQAIGYFESSSSKVVNVNNNGDRVSGEWSISSYCDRLMTTHRATFVFAKESNGSKISILKINP